MLHEENDNLRIVHVVLALDVGGLERGLINQIREGLALGERIGVICLERLGTLAGMLSEMDVPVHCLDKPPGLRLRLVGEVKRLLRGMRPDVVHCHQIGGLLYAGPASRCVGVPLVVHTEHGKENYSGSVRRRWVGRLSGRYARRFFCLSQDMARAVRRHRIVPSNKVVVVTNGIDTSRFQSRGRGPALRQQLGIPASAPVVGTVARLTGVKRQDVLLRGFARLRLSRPDAHLLIVGDGPLRGALHQQATEFGLGSTIHFAGHQDEPVAMYETMDVFALTSQSEGMPQSIMEAFAAGVPVVASRVGGIPEMIEDGRNGVLFTPGDELGLARSLGRLLTEPDFVQRVRDAAKVRVEREFDVRRMAAEYHSHFLRLLSISTATPTP